MKTTDVCELEQKFLSRYQPMVDYYVNTAINAMNKKSTKKNKEECSKKVISLKEYRDTCLSSLLNRLYDYDTTVFSKPLLNFLRSLTNRFITDMEKVLTAKYGNVRKIKISETEEDFSESHFNNRVTDSTLTGLVKLTVMR